MPTTSHSVAIANSSQADGYVQADGFYSPTTLGQPLAATTGTFSKGAAQLPFGAQIATGQLFYESAQGGITAHAGGGQANATPLTNELNVVTTVATAGDSVLLPPALAGLTIIVVNTTAKPMAVFPNGTDTIDAQAASASVTQMQGSNTIYTCGAVGGWTSNGIGTGYSGSIPTQSVTDSITAHAGGGQASATQLTTVLNRVTIVASAADSVKLPPSAPGMTIQVINSAATNSLQLFGTGADTINGAASGTGVAVAASKQANLTCYTAGAWVGPVALA